MTVGLLGVAFSYEERAMSAELEELISQLSAGQKSVLLKKVRRMLSCRSGQVGHELDEEASGVPRQTEAEPWPEGLRRR